MYPPFWMTNDDVIKYAHCLLLLVKWRYLGIPVKFLFWVYPCSRQNKSPTDGLAEKGAWMMFFNTSCILRCLLDSVTFEMALTRQVWYNQFLTAGSWTRPLQFITSPFVIARLVLIINIIKMRLKVPCFVLNINRTSANERSFFRNIIPFDALEQHVSNIHLFVREVASLDVICIEFQRKLFERRMLFKDRHWLFLDGLKYRI